MRNFILVFITAFASSCITLMVNPYPEQGPEGLTQWGGDTLVIRGDEDWFRLLPDEDWRRIQPLHHETTITTDTIR